MRRKSERNKSKGSPEKKVEKATRKSTRRRGKRATSSSPEREEVELKTQEATKSDDNAKESITQPATRLKIKELKSIAEEESSMKQITSSVNEPEIEKVQESGGGEGASVWKVARADASPGEIQKLKLCRQRNPSEASDSSSSRKKSHKSYESGEGDGDGEEGDSGAEELTRSGRNKDIESSERLDDPSSSNPRAQDFKEEVSHCSDEVLPRNTTSSSDSAKLNLLLSDDDDKMKLDRLAENSVQNDSEPDPNIVNEPSSNGDDFKPCENPADEREDVIVKIEEKVDEEKKEEEKKEEVAEEEGRKEEEAAVAPPSTEDTENKESISIIETRKESSSDDEDYKRRKSPESSENKSQDNRDEGRRNIRRKHRSKYHESSDSDTPESEDEPREKKMEDSEPVKEEIVVKTENESSTIPVDDRLGSNAEEEREEEDEEGKKKDRKEQKIVCDGEERSIYSIDDKNQDDEKDKSTIYKPPKVNLKRSFSSRFTEAEETSKKDDSEKKNGETEVPLHQEKDNNTATDDTEAKNIIPRKRRWGTTTTTVTAEVVPAFTVSTDSLKALVPGAKPLSITEVRLSKDDDEEKSRRKEREKRYSVGEDNGDKKIRDENVAAKIDALKKEQQLKHDNHIGAKRKISILKEMPRVKSPSPSFDKATNILLIKNLVRPFTLNQIKELLSRTGTIVENGFWIDGIKSKCYVVYSNEDQAFETRQALHGISWPVSNPKRLQVEYATKEDMDLARELSKDQPVQRKAEPLIGSDNWQQVWARDDKQNPALKVTTVREWDLGKEDGNQVKEKEREKKDLDKKRRQRSRSPPVEPHLPPPARKFKKKEDEPPPAKLLDDLFKKTKAIPCIYWLPLTNEQIVVKEEMRRQHMAEHARRLEEMKRAERSRDPGSRRRRSPRK